MWEYLLECLLVWEYLLELVESALAGRLLCCLTFSVLLVPLLVPTEVFWASVTPREVSLIGLSTWRVISLRKAENFIFSFIKFLAASPFLLSSSFSSSFPCHSFSFGRERASIDLALRKLPSFPKAFVILFGFFSVLLWKDLAFCVSCLAGGLFRLLSIRGAVSSPSSEYLCFLEMSVQDSECWGFFTEYLSVYSLPVSEERLEEEVEEEEEKE